MVPTNGLTEMIVARLDRIEDKLDALIKDVVVLKVKAGFYGGAVALVVSALVAVLAKAVLK